MEQERQFWQHYQTLLNDINIDKVVVVHVRRTDYIGNGGGLYHIGQKYHESAIAYMRRAIGSDIKLVVFSDDIAWCKVQSQFSGAQFVDD